MGIKNSLTPLHQTTQTNKPDQETPKYPIQQKARIFTICALKLVLPTSPNHPKTQIRSRKPQKTKHPILQKASIFTNFTSHTTKPCNILQLKTQRSLLTLSYIQKPEARISE